MLNRPRSYDKQLPGTPGAFRTLEESIRDQESRIAARRYVMLALSGELLPEEIVFPMTGLSIGATGELHTIAELAQLHGTLDKSVIPPRYSTPVL